MRALWAGCAAALVACSTSSSRTGSAATSTMGTSMASENRTGPAAPGASSNASDGFSDATVTGVELKGPTLTLRYRTKQGSVGEISSSGLPAGLSLRSSIATVSSERLQRPEGPRVLVTALDAQGAPVLLVGRGFGLGQKILGRYAFAPGKVLGPAPEPGRQAVTALLRDRDNAPVTEAAVGKLASFGTAPDAWQLAVTRATAGAAGDEAGPLLVDFVLVKP